MKKRGESKRSSAKRRKATKKAAKRSSKGKTAKPARTPVSKSIVSDQLWEIREAGQVVASEERGIRRWIDRLSAPEAFHYVSFFVSIVLLALLLNSKSLIFYIVITCAVLLFGGFLHRHHRPHPIMNIIAIFLVPVILTLALFRDSFVWLLGIVYLIAVVSTIIIYHHQRIVKGRIHDPLRIMWQVTYSKIVAITVTAIFATVLPRLLFGAKFISMFELSLLYLLPLMLIFFFLSKFLYLYFFDREHLKLDIMKSLHYTIMYTIAFLIVFICIYSIFAVSFYNRQMGAYNEYLDTSLYDANTLKDVLKAQPEGFSQLKVTMEFENYLDAYIAELGAEKSRVSSAQIAFGSVLDDSYLKEVGDARFNHLRFVIANIASVGINGKLTDTYQEMSGMTDGELNTRIASLNVVFESTGYLPGYTLDELFALMDDPASTSEDFENTGLFWIFSKQGDVQMIYYPDSIFTGEMVFVLKHTEFFRAVTTISVKTLMHVMDQQQAHNFMKMLILNKDTPESTLSKAIRYSIIVDDLKE